MDFRTVFPKISIVLIDATLFAYSSIPLNFLLLYGILTKFFGHSNSNCFLPSYFLPNLSLAAIFWAVSFFAFLFPLPTICFFIWNLYRYCFLNEAQSQNLLLIVGYGLAVVVAIVLRTTCTELLHFSPGRWLFNVSGNSKSTVTLRCKKHASNRILSLLVASELLQALQAIPISKKEFDSDRGVTEDAVPSRSASSIPKGKLVLSLIILVLMLVGLGLSSLWKLPLQAKASEMERTLPLWTGHWDVPACEAGRGLSFAGSGGFRDSLTDSALSHSRVKCHTEAIKQFSSVIKLCDFNMSSL